MPRMKGLPRMKVFPGDQPGALRIPLALERSATSDTLHALGLGSILASLVLWRRSAGISGQQERARAERRAIFVGLWPPTFFLLGKILQDIEASPEEQVQKGRAAAAG